MDENLKQALADLKVELEGKNKNEVKASLEVFETKYSDLIAKAKEDMKNEMDSEMKKLQDHCDALDVKLQKRISGQAQKEDAIKAIITEGYDEIKNVRKGHAVKLELKLVGDMTLGASLTGDQPRIYDSNVYAKPGQPINVADLVGQVVIDGGTYTFPRELSTGEGSPATQTEGSAKAQIDYDVSMIDVNTDFLAGFSVFSKKMANNLPFLESFLPVALRRDYWKAENAAFLARFVADATASTLTSGNEVERIIENQMKLATLNYMPNAVVVSPGDFFNLLVTEKSTGAGYGLPGAVSLVNGNLTINGLTVVVASWMTANKYLIGDFSYADKIVTQGLGIEFFEQDSDNVRKNNITARVEAQVALAIYRGDAFIYGDFTTTS